MAAHERMAAHVALTAAMQRAPRLSAWLSAAGNQERMDGRIKQVCMALLQRLAKQDARFTQQVQQITEIHVSQWRVNDLMDTADCLLQSAASAYEDTEMACSTLPILLHDAMSWIRSGIDPLEGGAGKMLLQVTIPPAFVLTRRTVKVEASPSGGAARHRIEMSGTLVPVEGAWIPQDRVVRFFDHRREPHAIIRSAIDKAILALLAQGDTRQIIEERIEYELQRSPRLSSALSGHAVRFQFAWGRYVVWRGNVPSVPVTVQISALSPCMIATSKKPFDALQNDQLDALILQLDADEFDAPPDPSDAGYQERMRQYQSRRSATLRRLRETWRAMPADQQIQKMVQHGK